MTRQESLREYIEQKRKQIDDLRFTYGDSVRPTWVGEEIGILGAYMDAAQNELDHMESKNAD